MTEASTGGRMRRLMGRLRHEPLFHFLLIGLALFVLYGIANPTGDDVGERIVVDRQRLAEFIQSRQATVDGDVETRIAAMSAAEATALIDEFVREEAMYREAERLGLAESDYLIRRRLAKSLDFLYRNMAELPDPTDQQLRAYYAAHPDRYGASPSITFSHINFSDARRGADDAERMARRTLQDIRTRGEEAVLGARWPGDRFAYQLNYAERDKSLIASHFGEAMADKLFAVAPEAGRWQGPYRSTSGWHLVRIEERASARQLPFEVVRAQVLRDWTEAQKEARADAAYDQLRSRYQVVFSDEVRAMTQRAPEAK